MTDVAASESSALAAVARIAPAAADGYRGMRAIVDVDGALAASVKALLVAVAAAVRGHDALARRELARGRALGLDDDRVATAVTTLLLSRGEGASERLLAAAGPLAPQAPPRDADTRDAHAYFLAYAEADALPPRNAVLADRAPAFFAAYHRLHHAALRADPEQAKLAELVCVVVNAAELEGPFVTVHAHGARRVGASEAELLETVMCAVPVAGIAAWAASFEALTA